MVDITHRLGCVRGGAAVVKAHPWFAGIDWNALLYKRHFGPIHPKVINPQDTSNFFAQTPDEQTNFESPLFNGDQELFKDF